MHGHGDGHKHPPKKVKSTRRIGGTIEQLMPEMGNNMDRYDDIDESPDFNMGSLYSLDSSSSE